MTAILTSLLSFIFLPYIPTELPAPPQRELTATEADDVAMLILAECAVFAQFEGDLFEECGLSVLDNVEMRVQSDVWPDDWHDVICQGYGDHWQYPCWAVQPDGCPDVVRVCPSEAYWLHRDAYKVVSAWEDGFRGKCSGYEFYHSIPDLWPLGDTCRIETGIIFVEFYDRP